jgi:hypothetical protein
MAARNSIVLWKEIQEIADKVCKHYGLTYGKILPETRKLVRLYGECQPCDKCSRAEHINYKNCSEKVLYIRIHQLNRPRKALSTSTILRTLAHELAHLRYWNHTKEHKGFEKEIVDFMRGMGCEGL